MNLSAEHELTLLNIARQSLRAALGVTSPPALPDDPILAQPAGCFVSLHQTVGHRLRGCVGRLDASAPLGRTVCMMAQAVLEDPRFLTDPVTPDELPALDIELSVLSPLEPAAHSLDFDLLNDGIYMTYGDRSGCFLPQVARETGWDKTHLLERLCTEKMGLPAIAWRHPAARLHRFRVRQIGPVRFVAGA
jgi:AmmeMemoRadiSam system protein A